MLSDTMSDLIFYLFFWTPCRFLPTRVAIVLIASGSKGFSFACSPRNCNEGDFFPNLALNRLQVSILEPVEFMFSTMKILSSVLTRAMLISYHDSWFCFYSFHRVSQIHKTEQKWHEKNFRFLLSIFAYPIILRHIMKSYYLFKKDTFFTPCIVS